MGCATAPLAAVPCLPSLSRPPQHSWDPGIVTWGPWRAKFAASASLGAEGQFAGAALGPGARPAPRPAAGDPAGIDGGPHGARGARWQSQVLTSDAPRLRGPPCRAAPSPGGRAPDAGARCPACLPPGGAQASALFPLNCPCPAGRALPRPPHMLLPLIFVPCRAPTPCRRRLCG